MGISYTKNQEKQSYNKSKKAKWESVGKKGLGQKWNNKTSDDRV